MLVKSSCLGMLLFLGSTLIACGQPTRPQEETPRHVIFFIADGMGVSALATVATIKERAGEPLTLVDMPVTGLVRTNAYGQVVTESAAGATALATGVNTVRLHVGVGPDSTRLPTIVEAARDQGFATGIITTTKLVDATPAGFAAHNYSRYAADAIADEMIASRVDVLFGGDGGVFTPDKKDAARRAGYAVIERNEALRDDVGGRLLGLFSERTPGTDAYGPPLADMTARALDLLTRNGRPIFLVVEQEETDTGAHKNDLPRVLAGVEELDAAIRVALDFAGRTGDTLVLLTADHDTGGYSETEDEYAVRWLTTKHTNQWVPILAFGPGASAFTGIHTNTDIPRLLAALLGLDDFPPSDTAGSDTAGGD